MAEIQLDDVFFSYNNTPSGEVLSGLTLTLKAGSFVSVVGPNGSGKSTFSKLLNGLLIPEKGEIRVDGLSTKERNNLSQIRRKVGVVFQNPDNQIVGDTVEDDVAFGPENLGLERDEITERVTSSLKSTGLEEKRFLSPSALSGGEKARLALAGILALSPECLVLDEVTAMLDPEGREAVLSILEKECREKGKSVILITHHPEETLRSDRIIVIADKAILFDGRPEEVYANGAVLSEKGVPLPFLVRLGMKLEKDGEKEGPVLSPEALWKRIGRENG